LGPSIAGRHVLCLAAGGGRHSALYCAAGAIVTVVDISPGMLELDREVARQRQLQVRLIEGTMTSLPMLKDRELTEADRRAGVRIDCEVVLGAHTSSAKTVATDHAVRYIEIEVAAHVRTGRGGNNCDGRLRLVTNLMDVPADLIAEAYRLRWLVELFFRMMKQLLGCRHLLSTKRGGVEIQMYLAIIACLLILIYTGSQPNKRTYEMICFYLLGWASLEELEAHIAKLKAKSA
jgi:SAM-dependent methyltransferase